MADGYRYTQPTAGSYYYSQNTQPLRSRHPNRNGSPPGPVRPQFSADTPSPSRSPDSHSSTPNLYGMYGQGHQGGPHARVNGGPGGQRMPLMQYNNYQHQNSHQQSHPQHHQAIQQGEALHHANGNTLAHHTNYSSTVLSSNTPTFTPNSMSNGHAPTTRGGQAQLISEHWAEQLKLHKETERAHEIMLAGAPNHYARTKSHDHRNLAASESTTDQDNDVVDRSKPGIMQNANKRQDWHSLDMGGQGLKVLTPPLFAFTFLNELYVASNQIRVLPAAIGHLRALTYLDVSNNALQQLPKELGMCVFLKSLLLFNNKLHTLPDTLGSMMYLEMLGIEGNMELDPSYKELIMESGTKSLVAHLRENAQVPPPPAPREIVQLTSEETSQERLKVLSYNILCDRMATVALYGYTPSLALAWENRKQTILEQIVTYDADIVCLQEIDSDNFKEFFSMQLAHHDYKGVFWPKGRARTMQEKDARMVDGCATFFKKGKFICLDKQLVDFAQLAINRPDMKSQPDVFNRVGPLDHIAVITGFENRMTGERFIIANTHLFWDTAFADVKIIQTAILLDSVKKYADKFAKEPACTNKKNYTFSDETETDRPVAPTQEPAPSMKYESSAQIPLIICGDFNSTVDSAVYELLAQGSVQPDHPEFGTHKYGSFTNDGIQHPFSLRSVYSHVHGRPEELPFTNYTASFQGVIEYIWYATNTLDVVSLLGPPDPEYMKLVPGFPHYHFPSDHIPLLAEFTLKNNHKKEVMAHTKPDFGPQSRERRH